jgi:hypothetical protein
MTGGLTATYRLYGLNVASQLPLYLTRPPVDEQPDIIVRLAGRREVPTEPQAGSLLAEFVVGDRRLYTMTTGESGEHVLRFHGAVEFVVSADLATVDTFIEPEVDEGLAAVLVTGTMMSFQLAMRRLPVLHASAVDLGSRALAFVGASGQGKSTMATLMCSAGASIVTDDVLRVELDDGAVRCHLGATEARLRKSAAELVSTFDKPPSARKTGDHRDALELTASDNDHLPLAAIAIPVPSRDLDAVEVIPLKQAEALLTLSRYPRIVGWSEPTVLADQFGILASLVARVPVYLAHVPWGPPFRPDLARQLLDGLALEQQEATLQA